MHEASPETLERGFGTLATDIVLVYYKPYVSCVIKEFEPITCFERIIIDRGFTLIADLCIVNLTDRFRMKLWLYLAIVTFRSQQTDIAVRETNYNEHVEMVDKSIREEDIENGTFYRCFCSMTI